MEGYSAPGLEREGGWGKGGRKTGRKTEEARQLERERERERGSGAEQRAKSGGEDEKGKKRDRQVRRGQ